MKLKLTGDRITSVKVMRVLANHLLDFLHFHSWDMMAPPLEVVGLLNRSALTCPPKARTSCSHAANG